jgi:TRAP-type mannitol/chloroaromatic compound transport system permease small subunit
LQEPVAAPMHHPGIAERGPFGRLLLLVSKWFAFAGGVIFTGLVIMSIVSIVGRKLFSAPVPGDVEVLQMFAAFASATFFAYTHLMHGDVKVDFFTANIASDKRRFLDATGSFLVGMVGTALTWRTWAGAVSLREAGESSAILAIPVWIAQMLMVPSFLLLALAGFYMCVQTWNQEGRKS